MPLHLLDGRRTSATPRLASQRRRTSAGMSENRRKCSTGCQIGPSVNVNPEPSWPTGAKGSIRASNSGLRTAWVMGRLLSSSSRHCEQQQPSLRAQRSNPRFRCRSPAEFGAPRPLTPCVTKTFATRRALLARRTYVSWRDGLLRCARNDGERRPQPSLRATAKQPRLSHSWRPLIWVASLCSQ